jgi:hypothetical protein
MKKGYNFVASLRGAVVQTMAEIIPILPDQDNACVGK